jgi:hypothetical protein
MTVSVRWYSIPDRFKNYRTKKARRNLPQGPSPLYPAMEKFVWDAWERLDREYITRWAFFNVEKDLSVLDFHGRKISMGGGHLAFDGAPRDVFWQSARPFLEDITVRAIDEVVKSAHGQCELRQPLLEVQGMLISCTRKTYARMATIDRRLRGKGRPDSVPIRDTARETAEMESFIARHVDGPLRLIPKSSQWARANQWFKDHPLLGWLVATTLTLLGIVGKMMGAW